MQKSACQTLMQWGKQAYIPLEVRSDGQVDLQHRSGDRLHMCAQLQSRKVVDEPETANQAITRGLMTVTMSCRWQAGLLKAHRLGDILGNALTLGHCSAGKCGAQNC